MCYSTHKSSNHALNLHRLTSCALLYSSSLLLACCTPPAYCYPLVCVLLPLLLTRNCSEHSWTLTYIAAERTFITGNTSRGHYLLLCDVTADMENTASSVVACWTVFTELLPGSASIKSVTICKRGKLGIHVTHPLLPSLVFRDSPPLLFPVPYTT
jgi:hypothetical protein